MARAPVKQIYQNTDASLKKTVFLDRDGVLINEVDYLSNVKQIQLLPTVVNGIKKLNDSNVVIIVVTNQPVIARGLATIKDVMLINDTLVAKLNKRFAYINAIYFCPHHPEKNHSDIPTHSMKYRILCECRKPKLAMLKKAIEDFNINLESAYFVGDRTSDIKTGENLGITTILVKTGYEGKDNVYSVAPDYICGDFNEAAAIITKCATKKES